MTKTPNAKDLCAFCKHERKGHAKPGPKPDHPGFRTYSKQGIDVGNSTYYKTTKFAFCENPICCCVNFVEEDADDFTKRTGFPPISFRDETAAAANNKISRRRK
jgi:hypothetical protein